MKTEKEIKDKIKVYRAAEKYMRKEKDIPYAAVIAVSMAKAILEWVLVSSEASDK